jgi:hypothetical protein
MADDYIPWWVPAEHPVRGAPPADPAPDPARKRQRMPRDPAPEQPAEKG